mgnify:FL=1
MKYTLTLKQSPQAPSSVELEGDSILLNDVNLPEHIEHTFNPYNVKLWVIGNEYGALCAAWGSNEQEALDAAVDAGLLDSLMDEEQDYNNEALTPLGNAGELFDLDYVWMGKVEFDAARDIKLIVALVRESVEGKDTL